MIHENQRLQGEGSGSSNEEEDDGTYDGIREVEMKDLKAE